MISVAASFRSVSSLPLSLFLSFFVDVFLIFEVCSIEVACSKCYCEFVRVCDEGVCVRARVCVCVRDRGVICRGDCIGKISSFFEKFVSIFNIFFNRTTTKKMQLKFFEAHTHNHCTFLY